MVDIFIAYAREDRERIASLADTLEHWSWSVRRFEAMPYNDMPPERGDVFNDATEARCIVVAWSLHSVNSEWICRLMEKVQDHKNVIHIRLEDLSIRFNIGTELVYDMFG